MVNVEMLKAAAKKLKGQKVFLNEDGSILAQVAAGKMRQVGCIVGDQDSAFRANQADEALCEGYKVLAFEDHDRYYGKA